MTHMRANFTLLRQHYRCLAQNRYMCQVFMLAFCRVKSTNVAPEYADVAPKLAFLGRFHLYQFCKPKLTDPFEVRGRFNPSQSQTFNGTPMPLDF